MTFSRAKPWWLLPFLVFSAAFTKCNDPVPKIGPLSKDAIKGHAFATVEPGETEIIRIEAEYGTRPTYEHALQLFWNSSNIALTSPDSGNGVSLPLKTPFLAKFMFGRDYPLFDGQVVDVQFKVFYRRPGSATEFMFWSQRESFIATRGGLVPTDLCVLRYRRATGPLEGEPNMPEEQATAHHFDTTLGPENTTMTGTFPFLTDWQYAGRTRESFFECGSDHPCYGAHARVLKNVGRNIINVTLNRPVGKRYEHLNPGDSVTVHEDIESISCNRFVNPETVIDALCRAAPEEPACKARNP